MTRLVWDVLGTRTYESGLDRGVLYLSDGRAIPWNGLTSIVEKNTTEVSPLYYDGVKIQDRVVLGQFTATMKAITYPDEFVAIEGLGYVRYGVWLGEQVPEVFNLSYRTLVGSDTEGIEAGYKIHLVYNITASSNDKTYATLSTDPSLVEFEWSINSVPDELVGFRPTAHVILDSRDMDPWLLTDIEEKLYGAEFSEANLPPIAELIEYMQNWWRWRVIHNPDGTYTLVSSRGDAIEFTDLVDVETESDLDVFRAMGVYVVKHSDGSFTVYDTYDINEIPVVRIIDNGDGSWTAVPERPELISVDGDGYFEINEANAVMTSLDRYKLSDTKRMT